MPEFNITQFNNLPAILMGVVVLALFYFMYRSNRRTVDKMTGPRRSVAYECVATPVQKAKPDLIEKFPQLNELPSRENISLVRFGIFNWGELALEPDQITEDITAQFDDGSEVLSATLGEMIKTETKPDEAPRVEGTRVTFPRFAIAPRGTVIFDLIIRGNGKPGSVHGVIEGSGPIRRLS